MTRDERNALGLLLVRLADGDRDAFSGVFAVAWPLLRGFAHRVLGDPTEADDVAQRALLNVFSRASEYDSTRDPLAWLLGITRWECRTQMRKVARRRESPLVGDDRHEPGTPEDELLTSELMSLLGDCLAELSLSDRQALGLSAADSSLPSTTLRKRKQRVLARLRESWKKHEH
jgi:RNA polymerase sigma-70 factor (ECF subfamily)